MPLPVTPAGDAVKLEETYERWKRYHDELDMYERHPRRWLRQHGQSRGLREHMTLADKVTYFGEVMWPVLVPCTVMGGQLAYHFLRRAGR